MGTTGPSSTNPATGKPYGPDFPDISVGDIVNVHRMLLKHLGIERLSAVIGGSFGGMQALEWAIYHPAEIGHCVVIASAAQLSAQALAFDIIGCRAITKDPDWQGGGYYGTGRTPEHGLSQARKLAHVTYLSQEVMSRKFGRERREDWVNASPDIAEKAKRDFRTSFQVESYLEHQGNKFTQRFDANSYLHITRAMDEFDLNERFGSLDAAVSPIEAKVMVVGLSGDWLFLPEQAMDVAAALQRKGKRVSFCRLNSPHGHDAFLTQVEHLSEVVHAFLPWVGAEKRWNAEDGGGDPLIQQGNDAIMSLLEDDAESVIDLGCGKGDLLARLSSTGRHVVGVDIDLNNVIKVIEQGRNVLLDDIERGLSSLSDSTYDCAVLNDSLQVVLHPRIVLREALRVASKAIVAFPNFGYLTLRTELFMRGRMPKRENLPFDWYNTPNIHLFTLRDFRKLCSEDGIRIEEMKLVTTSALGRGLLRLGKYNLGAERVVVRVSRIDS